MHRLKKKRLRQKLIGWAWVLALFASPGFAATSANLDIHVSISGSKSLLVDSTSYSFGALDINTSSVSATAIAVTNNSTVFIETYTITGANAISDTGGTDWTLAASPGANAYALAAQFSDTAPSDADGSWTSDSLTTSAIICSDQRLGNNTPGETGSNVAPGGVRNLWFRIKTPVLVADSGGHTATVVLSVL